MLSYPSRPLPPSRMIGQIIGQIVVGRIGQRSNAVRPISSRWVEIDALPHPTPLPPSFPPHPPPSCAQRRSATRRTCSASPRSSSDLKSRKTSFFRNSNSRKDLVFFCGIQSPNQPACGQAGRPRRRHPPARSLGRRRRASLSSLSAAAGFLGATGKRRRGESAERPGGGSAGPRGSPGAGWSEVFLKAL